MKSVRQHCILSISGLTGSVVVAFGGNLADLEHIALADCRRFALWRSGCPRSRGGRADSAGSRNHSVPELTSFALATTAATAGCGFRRPMLHPTTASRSSTRTLGATRTSAGALERRNAAGCLLVIADGQHPLLGRVQATVVRGVGVDGIAVVLRLLAGVDQGTDVDRLVLANDDVLAARADRVAGPHLYAPARVAQTSSPHTTPHPCR